ncbi:MAG: coproporphyrinogen III oxidase, partial [Bacilli bacterium]|nr:coproporphyrinogen III oxidase [Bacilli bacterium]
MIQSCYIHIPFCSHICSYCDFSKMYYNSAWCKRYLKSLEKEINTYYQGEELSTLYLGGGTPSSLSVEKLKQLFLILRKLRRKKDCEFTIECNIENITKEK